MQNLKAILLSKTMFTKRTYSLLKCAFTEIYSTSIVEGLLPKTHQYLFRYCCVAIINK